MYKLSQKNANPLRIRQAQAIAITAPRGNARISVLGVTPRDVLSFHTFACLLVMFFVVKAVLLQSYGLTGYTERLDMFADGNLAQQIGGRLLAIDPFTMLLSKLLGGA